MVLEKTFFITQNMLGSLGDEVKPKGILDLFQTAAGLYETEAGLSMQRLISEGYCWVLESIEYEQVLPLKQGETKVEVKAYRPVKAFYDMDFKMYDFCGRTAVKGSSRWLIIKADTRRIDLSGRFMYPVGVEKNEKFGELKRIKDSFDGAEPSGTFTVRKSDTDIVGHLNNTVYADVIFEIFPFPLKKLHIDYVKETLFKETLSVFCKSDGARKLIVGKADGEVRFKAEIEI